VVSPQGLSDRLRDVGMPFVQRHLDHPAVAALSRGDWPDEVARAWLEQDFLFLVDETRVLTRLAWQAPDGHRQDLVDLVWGVYHEEIPNHREMCSTFGAQPDQARKNAACAAYTSWLLQAASDYGLGLVALFSGLWAYSTLGGLLDLPAEPRFRAWVESYKSPDFAALAARFAEMVDETDLDFDAAREVFVAGLQHGVGFWDVSPS
jgi:thiaminase/transcriptional activator TenA